MLHNMMSDLIKNCILSPLFNLFAFYYTYTLFITFII